MSADNSSKFILPDLDARVKWSIQLLDVPTGGILAAHHPHSVCETASIGKVFLLIEIARRIGDGSLDPDQRIEIPPEHVVRDSGLLSYMRDQRITIYDACLLVGAVSDNLATNALIALCGLTSVVAVAGELGYTQTSLLDYIRVGRGPGLPWTPSYGTAAELSRLLAALSEDLIVSKDVSELVKSWLSTGVDTSMVAKGLLLDPLAHVEPEYQGILLRHKTGSTEFARIDVGMVHGPARHVAYAVAANWKDQPKDLREPVLRAMHDIGEKIRVLVTATP